MCCDEIRQKECLLGCAGPADASLCIPGWTARLRDRVASLEEIGASDLPPLSCFCPRAVYQPPSFFHSGSCNQGTHRFLYPSAPSQGVCGWLLVSGLPALQHPRSVPPRMMYSVMLNQLYGQPLGMQASAHDGWRTSSCSANHLRFVADLQEPHTGVVRPVMPRIP